jgi:hypothetical protein
MLTEPAPDLLIEVLRGDRDRRPLRDDHCAAGLRATLEDHVFELFGPERRATPTVISSATLRGSGQVSELFDSPLGRARGILISTVFRLLVTHVHVQDPYDDALTAWRGEHPRDELVELLTHFDHDQVARLRADVHAHYCTLVRGVGPIPSSWLPRTSQRARQSLGGGSVELRDVVDLVVGSTHGDVASVALVDITTSPLGAGAERALRYHALVQTLRTSIVPLRTVAFSSATGELWVLDVDHELLTRSLEDLVQALARERASQ